MGLVDNSGIIQQIPESASDLVVRFSDGESAKAAVAKGEIGGYYVVSADYMATGQVDLFKSELNVIGRFR